METANVKETRRDPKKKPQFSSKLRDLEVAKGSRIKMTCSVIGSPEPEIEWFHNGFPLTSDQKKYVAQLDSMGIASLEIRNLVRSDTGEYTCTARNSNGQSSTSADLRVRGDFEPKPSPPTFTTGIKGKPGCHHSRFLLGPGFDPSQSLLFIIH